MQLCTDCVHVQPSHQMYSLSEVPASRYLLAAALCALQVSLLIRRRSHHPEVGFEYP